MAIWYCFQGVNRSGHLARISGEPGHRSKVYDIMIINYEAAMNGVKAF